MAGTYRSEYTGAQIDASVAFGHNPDSTPTANSVAGVISGGVKAAIDAEATARQAADTTLQNNIGAETTAREQADNTLSAAVATKQDILTFDNVPAQNSSNPVKSSGIWQKNRELYSAMQGGDADILAEMHENYAKVDGAYETLTAGNAEQLLATQYVEDSVPYIFRPSGNHADIGDREFDTVVGASIVWNQLMPTFSAATTGTSQQQFIQVAGQNDVFTVGHKYFVRVDVTSLSDYADCRMRYPSVRYLFAERNQFIVDATNANFAIELESSDGSDVQLALPANYAMACDLTLMLGPAVADYIYNLELAGTGAGVAYLLNLIPLLGGDYMAQNAGTMLSVNASAHETVGFNQWDEEWDNGTIDPTTGQNAVAGTNVRSKNYIPVIPGQTYYYKNGTGIKANLRYYDAEKNYIGYSNDGNANATFVIPQNTHFIRFYVLTTYGTTYKNDICINISWNGTRNGEYEPYEKRTYLLTEGELYPATTLRGLPVVENSKVRYDGDIYNPDGTVERRYGVVDLGTLAWTRGQATIGGVVYYYWTTSDITDIRTPAANTEAPTWLIAEKYLPIRSTALISIANTVSVQTTGKVLCSTSDPLSQVVTPTGKLVYELATPTTESATPYQSPQIVDDWGTERYVDFEYSVGQRPIPVPVGHDTKYPANLRDKVQHLPSLADADGTYAIQQAGTQMSLVPLPVVIPEPPSANGTYTLKATVSGGAATLTWEV